MSDRPPRLGLTTGRQVGVAALAGAVVSLAVVTLVEAAESFVPVVPWTVPAVLVVLAIGTWIYARALPKRIDDGEASGIEGVRALIVAKSMVMTGATMAGGMAVYVGRFVAHMEAAQPAQRVYYGGATLVASLLLALAGFLLEKACIVNLDDPDDDGDAQPSSSAA